MSAMPATLARDWEIPLARHFGLDLATVVSGSFEVLGAYAEHDDDAMTRIGWIEVQGDRQTRVETEIPTAEFAALGPRPKSRQRYLQDPDGGKVQRPRIPDATWGPALERAQAEDRPIGHVLTDLLNLWLAGNIDLEGKP
jgi:hypothetical protein